MRYRTSLLVIFILLVAMISQSFGHLVKLNDTFTIEDTKLFLKGSINASINGSTNGSTNGSINGSLTPTPQTKIQCLLTKIRKFLNPLYWVQKFFELIPETAFWLLGVDNYDCRYLTICQTSNYLINNAPKFMSSMLKGQHTGILSTILGETPYIEAWSIGSIKSIECPLLYNCPEPPFNLTSN